MPGIGGQVLSRPPKKQILTVVLQNLKKTDLKHPTEKPMLLYFVELTNVLCPRLHFLAVCPWNI